MSEEKKISLTVRQENYILPENKVDFKHDAPLLLIQHQVLMPHILSPIMIDEASDIAVIQAALAGDRMVAIFNLVESNGLPAEDGLDIRLGTVKIDAGEVTSVGVVARIVKVLNFPDGSMRVLFRAVKRVGLIEVFSELDDVPHALFEDLPEESSIPKEVKAKVRIAIARFQELIGLLPNFPDELKLAISNVDDPTRIVDLIADSMPIRYIEKLALLSIPSLSRRLDLLLILLNREVELSQLSSRIQSQVQQAVGQSQKEFFLREQLAQIQAELGEDNRNPDVIEFERRLNEGNYPDEVRKVVEKELGRIVMIPQAAPEYHVSYNYMDWLLSVPWTECSEECLDGVRAEKVLNEDHYGLEEVKSRILEFLAVLQLKNDRKAPILCLVGPPGVGKTSLGRSIARAMNRKYIRVALGGVRDEAEIRGHRRTYIGAMPGRIIQNMKKVGTVNPVFMLDEIDKLGNDFRGDPASALLEVLDPEQNKAFNDHYLELDYDLSKVFFIATANVLEDIPAALQDRMEVIRLSGYTSYEKKQIAKKYLVPRQMEANGFKKGQVLFTAGAIDEIIDYYTREAGVRQLERTIGQVFRRLARKVVSGELSTEEKLKVQPATVRELLGHRKFLQDEADRDPGVGCATGMAWTSVGGTVLTVESVMMPGKGQLKLTGSLGNVMKESAEAAMSCLRGSSTRLGINPELFDTHDFHIHVPDGATPKDGPSAGITIFSALYSLMTGKKVRPSLSMTGEITLRGRITAVGGIKEKVIGALRAGVQDILLPRENTKDLEDIPEELRAKLHFHPVGNIDEALRVVFPNTGE